MGLLGASAPAAAGAFDLLETTVLTSSASSVTFSGLDAYSDYKHLQIRAVTKTAGTSQPNGLLRIRINNDSTLSYSSHRISGDGVSVASGFQTDVDQMYLGITTSSQAESENFGSAVIDVLDFSSSTKNKTFRSLNGLVSSPSNSISIRSGLYFKTDPITTMSIFDSRGENWVTGSRFSLYGVK